MPNEMIRRNMILTGVSITELADMLGVTDEMMIGKLNSEMGIMESFKVMSAVSGIKQGKERT